jgi:hypothetical protein
MQGAFAQCMGQRYVGEQKDARGHGITGFGVDYGVRGDAQGGRHACTVFHATDASRIRGPEPVAIAIAVAGC